MQFVRAKAVPLATPGEIRSRPQILARDWSAGIIVHIIIHGNLVNDVKGPDNVYIVARTN